MKISIIVPTRNRPQNVQNICKSVADTASGFYDIELVFYVDRDDANTIALFKDPDAAKKLNVSANVVVGDRVNLGQTYNKAYAKATGDIIMYAADDVYFGTKSWDFLVVDEFKHFKDQICLVFGYDGIQPKGALATHGFISRKSIDFLGYVHPGEFGYNYADMWMTELYRQIGRLRYIPIYTEHRHWGAGKAVYDDTYRLGSDAPHENSIDLWADYILPAEERVKPRWANSNLHKERKESKLYADIEKLHKLII
jgi:glycosyltransferase involved in cell wall biosynthesis